MFGGMINGIDYIINYLNTSRIFAGFMMLCLNIGGKYISAELTETHNYFLDNIYFRRFVIFVVVFYATRDIKIAIVVTLIFIFILNCILNEESRMCLIPKNYLKKMNTISEREYQKALNTINKYNKQKTQPQQPILQNKLLLQPIQQQQQTNQSITQLPQLQKNTLNSNFQTINHCDHNKKIFDLVLNSDYHIPNKHN